MATNKRKEAAALFELIDKSTLKVPKSGGNLKIPGWWSNKTNPSNKETPAGGAATKRAALSAGGVMVEDPPLPEPAPVKVPAQGPAPQSRLFEPPPAHVTPSSSPSIRPPKAPLAAVVADPVKVSSPGASAAADPAEGPKAAAAPMPGRTSAASAGASVSASRAAGAAGAVGAGASPATQVLLPPTMDPGRKTWVPPRPRSLPPLRWWAVGAVGAVLLMVVVGAVMIAKSGRKTVSPTTHAVERLHDGGSVARAKDLYYIVVYWTPAGNLKPAESPVYKHAKFLADHGEDVSIERVELPAGTSGRTESWYWVVSARGFATATEAWPYQERLKKIGDQMSPGVWKGAYARNGLSSSGGASAAR